MASKSPKKPVEPPPVPVRPPPSKQDPVPGAGRLKLGCAPLLAGIGLVALLGQILPRESRHPATPPPPKSPKAVQAEAKTKKPQSDTKTPAAKWVDVAKKPLSATDAKPSDTARKPPPAPDKKPTARETKAPVMVANSPWDGSVRQAERYLKNSQYDTASFEAIEWSPVTETKGGYQVRCKFRSKNVLGVYVVQTKTVLLNKFGEVYAVKESGGEARPAPGKAAPRP